MPKINVLGKDIAELIAAGEVIERPASVIKELVENSLDSGATSVTVEIKNGGTTYIRVTDNGCGMSEEDVPLAFLRHATSKISAKTDLDSILTLGFRGEALASICAVSRVELLTKRHEDDLGTHYCIEGGAETLNEKTGCPDGTTIIIRDIFYNVPARRKFLKKDVTEANAVTAVIHKQALSHPEAAFRFIKNNKAELVTAGDANLYTAIYAVYGREFANELVPVPEYVSGNTVVSGYTIKPLNAKTSHSLAVFFINDRCVRSMTCAAALDEAYKNLVMTGRFPACVLKLTVPPDTIDVNVHPTKSEIRFTNEKVIFEAVYFAVKNALMTNGLSYSLELEKKREAVDYSAQPLPSDKGVQLTLNSPTTAEVTVPALIAALHTTPVLYTTDVKEEAAAVKEEAPPPPSIPELAAPSALRPAPPPIISVEDDSRELDEQRERLSFSYISSNSFEKKESVEPPTPQPEKPRYIGEAFKNYILCELGEELILIDKHAAHERILFEELKKNTVSNAGQLIMGNVGTMLSDAEADALESSAALLERAGFSFDFSQKPLVIVKQIPMYLDSFDVDELLPELAAGFIGNGSCTAPSVLDDILHSIACRAAMKANDINSPDELIVIAERVISDPTIRHCPHGRPIMFTLSKTKLERQFKRLL